MYVPTEDKVYVSTQRSSMGFMVTIGAFTVYLATMLAHNLDIVLHSGGSRGSIVWNEGEVAGLEGEVAGLEGGVGAWRDLTVRALQG